MAQYDLTKKILPYLDRHLGFPLLLNPSLNKLYKPEEVSSATYELAKATDLVDFALGLYEQLHPDEPAPAGAHAPQYPSIACVDSIFIQCRVRRKASKDTGEYPKARAGGPSCIKRHRESRSCASPSPG